MAETKQEVTLLPELARTFRERAKNLNLRGVKRDSGAIEFFVGAAKACSLLGNEAEFNRIATFVAFGLAIDGYVALDKIDQPEEVKA